MTESQKWLILAGIVGFGGLMYLLAPVFVPFLAAAILAYLGNPVVELLQRWRLPRVVAAVIVFIMIFLVIALFLFWIVPILEKQISVFISEFPRYADKIRTDVVNPVLKKVGFEEISFNTQAMQKALAENWKDAGNSLATILGAISSSGLAVIQFFTNIVLIPVITFYMLRDWPRILGRISELIPRSREKVITHLCKESDRVLGGFLRGQFIVMLCLGMIYSVGLSILGLKLAFLIGMLAGLLSFVPYLGFIVGLATATIVMLTQIAGLPGDAGSLFQLVYVLMIFSIGQIIESVLLTPLLVGDRIGLHPVGVIFAILAGGQLFGFAGILLALPIAAIIVVWVRYMHEKYINSELYDRANSRVVK